MNDIPTLPALTLTAPWATFCVQKPLGSTLLRNPLPFKRHETRSWPIKARLPLRLAIHQGKGAAGMRDSLIVRDKEDPRYNTFRDPYYSLLKELHYSVIDPWMASPEGKNNLPLGAIVGVVTVTGCERTETILAAHFKQGSESPFTREDFELGNYQPERFAWAFEDAQALPVPIVTRGFQGIWTVPPAIVADMMLQGVTVKC